MPHCHHLCHALSTIVLSTPPLSTFLLSRYPCLQAISMPASSRFHQGHLLVCVPDVSVLLLFSVYGLLLYYFQFYFLLDYQLLWPRASPLWLLISFCVSSCCPVLCATCFHHRLHPSILPIPFISTNSPPPVLRISRRITLHFDVLGQSLMYLRLLA
jgi:hypothetical protein